MSATCAAIAPPLTDVQVSAQEFTDRLRFALSPDTAAVYATTPWLLAKIFTSSDIQARAKLAQNPAITASMLLALLDDPEIEVRRGAAGNPNLPAKILARLAEDSDRWVQYAVAGNPATPVACLDRFTTHPDLDMTSNVARNPATPHAILRRLAASEDSITDAVLAANPSLPGDLCAKLAMSRHEMTRSRIAVNPATPRAVLTQLVSDNDAGVRNAAEGAMRRPVTPTRRLRGTTVLSIVLRDPYVVWQVNAFFEDNEASITSNMALVAETLLPSWTSSLPALLDAVIASCRRT